MDIRYRYKSTKTNNYLKILSGQFYLKLYLFSQDDRCGPVPDILHAHHNTNNASDGSVVHYTCNDGYITVHGQTEFNISCLNTMWKNLHQSCDCKKNYCLISTSYLSMGHHK